MRYFIHLSYNGAAYKGWQRQNNVISVQEVLEDRLSQLFKKRVRVGGCGRTDAQVHASQYYAQMNIDEPWDFDICFRLNKMLPSDIVVYSITEMHYSAHALKDATERTYDYYFHTKDDPFMADFSSFYPEPHLDITAMQKAADLLSKYDDYRSFCKTPDKHNHTRCIVKSAFIEKNEETGNFHFQIVGNRFLRGMIRIIVAHLLEVGRGKESLEQLERLFIEKENTVNVKVADARGLYLSKITYPFLDEPTKSGFNRGLF